METFYTQFLLPSSTSGTSTRVKMSSILLLVFTLLITGKQYLVVNIWLIYGIHDLQGRIDKTPCLLTK